MHIENTDIISVICNSVLLEHIPPAISTFFKSVCFKIKKECLVLAFWFGGKLVGPRWLVDGVITQFEESEANSRV